LGYQDAAALIRKVQEVRPEEEVMETIKLIR
jgi:hypothetical protein